jgi:hypothetical protein
MKQRTIMMRMRALGATFYMLYFYLKEANAGLLGAFISFLGSTIQVITPEHLHEKTFKLRTILAVILASSGLCIFSGTVGVFPMLAVIIARFSEVSSCVQRIRFGLLAGQCCWLIYSIELMILPFIMTETILIISNLYASWKFYRFKESKI